jgi:cell division protein DivIC
MDKKKVSKTVRRRLTLLGPAFIGIVVICIITIFTYLYKIEELKKQQAKLDKQLHELKIEEKELSSEISKLKDPDYIAKYARENYYYTKDGEYVIKIEEKENTETVNQVENNRIYYILSLSVTAAIFILVIIRSNIKKRSK